MHFTQGAGAVSFRTTPILGRDAGSQFILDGEITEFHFYDGALTPG